MKDEEMAEEYCNHLQSEMLAYTPENPRQQRTVTLLDVEEAFLAGLKAGRPQWHKVADGDLPPYEKDNYTINVLTDCGDIAYYTYDDNCWVAEPSSVEIEPPIAWCEIPTFDKED